MGTGTVYLSVRETARRLGVHENTVRNWVTQGILRSARVPGTRFHRFEAAEVERLRTARGAAVASVEESRRVPIAALAEPAQLLHEGQVSRLPPGPHLADATQLTVWAGRREAHGLFPKLVRRLLVATPQVTDLSLRAEEGIGAPGWDGLVHATRGSRWVPMGSSGWELSAERKVREKAQEDYEKRTNDPLGVDPAKTAFVFATPRRWPGAAAWERERRADKVWRDVRVIDADGFETWLEAVPAIHYWLSEELGLRPRDGVTLERWWERFASRTRPPLPRKLLLAGRESQQQELDDFLEGEPAAIGLQAGSRDEAIAFLASTLSMSTGAPERPALVVTASELWDRLVSSTAPMTLIPSFDGPAVAAAVNAGHHVISPLGREDISRGQFIELPRVHRQVAHEALAEAGLSFEQANQLSGLARRSLASLMRKLAVDPRVARPSWGGGEAAAILAPLMLAGSWAASEADETTVAELVGVEWADIEGCLRRWSLTDDPPFIRSGSGWHLTSPEEAFDVLHPLLSTKVLERWKAIALRVLAETDPSHDLSAEERLTAMATVPQPSYSTTFRRGLASSMALLGASGAQETVGGRLTIAEHVREVVFRLLEAANADETGLFWRALSSELPLLAEAAPQEFLDAVEQGLAGDAPLLATMFRDSRDQSFLSTSSPHTGLLWALETICWSEEFFAQALMLLAHLAAIDPGGKLGNRPAASLRAVLLPWVPYTAATVDQRLEALRQVRKRYPEVGWHLLLDLLPRHHDHSSPTSSPRFRDWKPDREGVTLTDWAATIAGLVSQASEALVEQPSHWLQVVQHLGGLPPDLRSGLLDQLESDVGTNGRINAEQRLSLWRTLTSEIAHHREFPSAQWSMDDESLSQLERIASLLQPADAIARTADLFDWRPKLPGVDPFDHPTYEKALAEARGEAVALVLDSNGVAGLARLAAESPQPQFVGMTVAEVRGEVASAELLAWLGGADKQGEVASGWVRRMVDLHGTDWAASRIDELLALSPEGQAAFLRALPAGAVLLRLLGQVSETVRESYWRSTHPFTFLDDESTALAVEQLVAHDRSLAAVELLAMGLHDGKESPPGITADLVVSVLRAALSADPAEARWIQGFDYSIGELLDRVRELGANDDVVAQLEWAYFPLLEHSSHQPRALYAQLKQDPVFFVDLVSLVYRASNEQPRQLDEAAAAQARNAWSVLSAWREIPGYREDGSLDQEDLHQWVQKARLLLDERDRADIGDEQIGQMLSGSPPGTDGAWPAEAVRELIEGVGSRSLETGLHIGRMNSRGVTMRGVYNGGAQEHELALGYQEWARITGARWPRTSRVLRGIAEDYERQAREMDAEAEARASRD